MPTGRTFVVLATCGMLLKMKSLLIATHFAMLALAIPCSSGYAAPISTWQAPSPNRLMGRHALPWLTGVGATSNPICAESLVLAKRVFLSRSLKVSAPPGAIKHLGFSILLQPSTADPMSDLNADSEFFEEMPQNAGPVEGANATDDFHFQQQGYRLREPVFGRRLVVGVDNQSWKSNIYSIYAVPEGFSPDALLSKVNQLRLSPGSDVNSSPDAIVSYEPMWVLRDNSSGAIWVIDPGWYYGTWEPWKIYGLGAAGLTQQCLIHFRGDISGRYIPYPANHLLPRVVRRLAALLDSTLGSGEGDGELQSTWRLRVGARDVWEDIAFRPWALNSEPYNSTEEVDQGLQEWSMRSADTRAIYNSIQKQLPLARVALAGYYRRGFALSPKHADTMASYAIDLAYRTYFAFHSERAQALQPDAHAKLNPWPD